MEGYYRKNSCYISFIINIIENVYQNVKYCMQLMIEYLLLGMNKRREVSRRVTTGLK